MFPETSSNIRVRACEASLCDRQGSVHFCDDIRAGLESRAFTGKYCLERLWGAGALEEKAMAFQVIVVVVG